MANTIALVTDSTVDLPEEQREQLGITMVPLKLEFEGRTYTDGVDLKPAEFYQRYRHSASLPTTSQPNPEDFKQVYGRLLAQGHVIISLHLSSDLSGTHQSASLAAQAFDSERVHLVDSRFASIGMTLVAVRAAKAIAKGLDVTGVLRQIKCAIEQTELFFCVENLDYLHKGGRIGLAAHLLGSMINIKPILSMENGLIAPWAKVRGDKQVDGKILSEMQRRVKGPIDIAWVHADNRARIEPFIETVKEQFEVKNEFSGYLGAVIGAHVGPGAWGIAFLPALDTAHDR